MIDLSNIDILPLVVYIGIAVVCISVVFGYSHSRLFISRKENSVKARSFYIPLDYPGSDWGTDIVMFTVPETVSHFTLVHEIRQTLDRMNADSFFNSQDLADAALDIVAKKFSGEWNYISLSGTIQISSGQ